MQIFTLVLSIIWLLFFLMVSYGMFEITPGQMVKDKEFFEKEIKPAVKFVK